MTDKCRPEKRFPDSLVLILFACLFLILGRSFPHSMEAPVFSVAAEKNPVIWVELGTGFPEPGFRQFVDESSLADVIYLTLGRKPTPSQIAGWPGQPKVRSGERLEVNYNGQQIAGLRRGWMSAAARISLQLPLHPDRMTLSDWQALPGIGPKLAARIEADRQINGDFGSLSALRRVNGVGPKRLAAWKRFFF